MYGKNLFQEETVAEIMDRITHLAPELPRQWGTMEVAQMLAHCCISLEAPLGLKKTTRTFLGRTIGPFFKSVFTEDKPLKKNTPTDQTYLVQDARDFLTERDRLKKLIKQFYEAGQQGIGNRIHPFFGMLTAEQWARGAYKHLDHHLRQFNA